MTFNDVKETHFSAYKIETDDIDREFQALERWLNNLHNRHFPTKHKKLSSKHYNSPCIDARIL